MTSNELLNVHYGRMSAHVFQSQRVVSCFFRIGYPRMYTPVVLPWLRRWHIFWISPITSPTPSITASRGRIAGPMLVISATDLPLHAS